MDYDIIVVYPCRWRLPRQCRTYGESYCKKPSHLHLHSGSGGCDAILDIVEVIPESEISEPNNQTWRLRILYWKEHPRYSVWTAALSSELWTPQGRSLGRREITMKSPDPRLTLAIQSVHCTEYEVCVGKHDYGVLLRSSVRIRQGF